MRVALEVAVRKCTTSKCCWLKPVRVVSMGIGGTQFAHAMRLTWAAIRLHMEGAMTLYLLCFSLCGGYVLLSAYCLVASAKLYLHLTVSQ